MSFHYAATDRPTHELVTIDPGDNFLFNSKGLGLMCGNRGLPLTAHGNVENDQVFAPNYEHKIKGRLSSHNKG